MNIKKKLVQGYETVFPYFRRYSFRLRYRFEIMGFEQTVSYIKRTGCSIARFGDGEFGIMMGNSNPTFQSYNVQLANRLLEICKAHDEKVLVCIPHNFISTDDCNEFARDFWEWWMWEDKRIVKVAKLLSLSILKKRVFGDSQITRPYMDWKDKSHVEEKFSALKSIWCNCNILIVEGSQTKLGVGNDLFDNAKSIERVLAPSTNAFSVYNQILESVRIRANGKLVLIALGPTATVLAFDLGMLGFHALDIGHIDIEYEWFLKGATSKVAIDGKYVQEAHSEIVGTTLETEYSRQIVDVIMGESQ